jgi:M6 family metalloprotease-like protein
MKKILSGLLIVASFSLSYAMPPREGVEMPEGLSKAIESGRIDNPSNGLMPQLKAKFGTVKISGTRTYPVVMGYFTDQAQTFTQTAFQDSLFGAGGGKKTCYNYYKDMSYSAMTCTGKVQAWGSCGNTKATYANSTNPYGAYYDMFPGSACGFIVHVLQAIDAAVDFSDPLFDVDGDNYVDVLWVIHSGKGAEETTSINDIWSHSSNLSSWSSYGSAYATNDKRNNKTIYIDKYIIMPEVSNYSGYGNNKMIGRGVFCHEFGHALGLPDLYDTGTSSYAGEGLGQWACMASGSWGGDGSHAATPTSLCVWSKKYLGWISPKNITQNGKFTFNWSLADSHSSSVRMAKLGSSSATQYWLAENRNQSALGYYSGIAWDQYMLGSGLLVYHINEDTINKYLATNKVNANSTINSTRNRCYGVALEETDMTSAGYSSEMWSGTNRGDAADAWNSGTQANFDSTGTAYPCSFFNGTSSTASGGNSGIAIRKIPTAAKGTEGTKAMACTLYVIPGQAPNAVELGYFTGMLSNGKPYLSWRTESEFGCTSWEISRARDAGEYKLVKSIPGNYYSNQPVEYSFADNTVPEGGNYYYLLTEVDEDNNRTPYGPVNIIVPDFVTTSELSLLPCYPNPSRGDEITFSYTLPKAGNVTVKVFNILGQEVNALPQYGSAGKNFIPWDCRDGKGQKLSNGVYIYQIVYDNRKMTGKFTLVR